MRTLGVPVQARFALGIWWASRAALFVVVSLTSWVLAVPGPTRILEPGGWLLERFVWWDSFHFLRIAERGYLPPEQPCCDQAFFPGYPLAMKALSPVTGGSAVLAGLVITAIAVSIAVVLLARLATESAEDPRAGRAVVVLLAVSPFGLFLSSVYSEALFLAAALGAWLAGRHRRWWLAGALAGLAAGVRINGLFLAAGLAVMYLLQWQVQARADAGAGLRPRGLRAFWPGPSVLALGIPGAVVATYFGFLHARTGSWNNWQEAQVTAWNRQTDWPWNGLRVGWSQLVTAPSADLVLTRAADLVTVLAGLALVLVVARLRRWPEMVYLGLSLTVLVCSTTLVSAPRYALTWFPVYVVFAEWAIHRRGRWILPVAVTLGPALLVVYSLIFAHHYWLA